MSHLLKGLKPEKLPTKAEKAIAIANTIVSASQVSADMFRRFGEGVIGAGMAAAAMDAAMGRLTSIMQSQTQPEEHPLVKAVRKATETINQEEEDEKEEVGR